MHNVYCIINCNQLRISASNSRVGSNLLPIKRDNIFKPWSHQIWNWGLVEIIIYMYEQYTIVVMKAERNSNVW